MNSLTQLPAYKALEAHYQQTKHLQMRDLFAQDSSRFEKFSVQFNDILLDYSKNRITDQTMPLLIDLATSRNLKAWIDKMFSGQKINITEGRRCCTWLCATGLTGRSWSMARM